MAPVVSVVIATYNRSGVLRYAIETALGQTLKNIEVLVIGDGCTDDSPEVVAAFQDSRLLWHNLPSNTGSQSVPNNTGIAMARGCYVAYLSHDDLWMPHHLEALVSTVERDQADGGCVEARSPADRTRSLGRPALARAVPRGD